VEYLLVARKSPLLKLDFNEVGNTIDSTTEIRSSTTNVAKIQNRATKLAIATNNVTVIAISLAILPHLGFTWISSQPDLTAPHLTADDSRDAVLLDAEHAADLVLLQLADEVQVTNRTRGDR
jgi:hypothetical protein